METIIILTAVLAFIATNLDDMFILAAFFAHPHFKSSHVIFGQYLGFITLLIISFLAYFVQLVIPASWISILGIIPIIIGIRSLLTLKNSKTKDELTEGELSRKLNSSNNNVFSVAAVTIVNGGDNLGVYMPLFASSNPESLLIMVVTFLLMVGVWCLMGYKLVNNSLLGDKIRKYGHMILPLVMICIGVVIIVKGWI